VAASWSKEETMLGEFGSGRFQAIVVTRKRICLDAC
jgi:hypothetical protein